MWSKIFASKLDSKLDAIVAQEIHKPVELDTSKELDIAKSEALRKVVTKRVTESLSRHFNTEVYEQTEKAIQLFNSTLQEALVDINRDDLKETRSVIFNRVLKEYPKASTNYSHHYGYNFVMPDLTVTTIVNGITDKIIAEIAEMD